jgi:hypothetical protein
VLELEHLHLKPERKTMSMVNNSLMIIVATYTIAHVPQKIHMGVLPDLVSRGVQTHLSADQTDSHLSYSPARASRQFQQNAVLQFRVKAKTA